ncbi:MAG TPA: sigma 54-interacting transcriptional regulator [Anaeromyxobacteraceae bacterium]|nr:sigma 54-interacting transcriptional regulator [Anaeromyxobacteraceae bacterium]
MTEGSPSPGGLAAPGELSLDQDEQTALLPLLERLSSGELRRVEGELLALLASGRLGTLAGRAMAAQALARIALLARADVCGAFATLSPLLPELSRLPAAAQLELQVTAALVFSWPDGRFLDAGRANAYLAGAERLLPGLGTPETRVLLLIARFTLALLQEDPERVVDALTRATELEPALTSPVHRTLVHEAQAQAAFQAGRFAGAARSFQQVLDEGALALSRVRALGQLAAASIQDGRAPREALALIERARDLERRERLQPGQHSLMLDAAGAALGRLGRFADAAHTLEEAIDLAAEVGWTPAWPAMTLAQIHVWTGRADALRALGERLAVHEGGLLARLTRALGGLLKTAAGLLGATQDGTGLVGELERQVEELEREVGWHTLRGQVLLTTAMISSRAGTPEEAGRALRRADRHFERAPSIWAGALLRRSRGAALARQGQLHEARQLIESALGTLTLAEDIANATHARLMLAQIGLALGDPGAREQAARHRDALRQLGYVFGLDDLDALPPARTSPAGPPAGGAAASAGSPPEQLVVPIQRLATRGMNPALIRRELVAVVAELASGPGAEAAVCLEELDSTGRATPILRTGPEAVPATDWVELSDGAGRRLRLGAGGPGMGGEARGRLAALGAVAELALELAALRGVAGNAAPTGTPLGGGEVPDIPGFISTSTPMRQLKADLARLSRSRATVIITGESGSGKEVIARAIHDLSTRAGKPYLAFNCAAVPRDLFEGQLFGYRKGAFTGAATDQPGVLRSADGGTVLLDEIGELPLDVQPKLLRFLENGEILPLGERQPVKLDVRVIAATFRDLDELVRERRFREDLYYRLQVVPLRVPPLRERPDDVIALARHFVRLLTPAGQEPPVLAPDALTALNAHRWPGNVRELRNVIERSLAFEPMPRVLEAQHLRITV